MAETRSGIASWLKKLRTRRMSTLIVPVREAEPSLAAAGADSHCAGDRALPPHITVLYPFVPARQIDASVLHAISVALAGFGPFDFALTHIGYFPGVVYLTPEPVEPFQQLTAALSARWPEYPPYNGAYDQLVPHLTVAMGPLRAGVVHELEHSLPIHARARELSLLTPDRNGRWSLYARFRLGRAVSSLESRR